MSAVWCHDHDRHECAHIHWTDDPDIKIKVPKAACCHAPATDGPWCRVHLPLPEATR